MTGDKNSSDLDLGPDEPQDEQARDSRTEFMLRETQRRLREAQRIANLGSWDWNVITGELWWSHQLYVVFGLNPNSIELSYERFLTFVHPEDVDVVDRVVRDALDGADPKEIVHRIVRPDGELRYIQWIAEVFRDESGNAVRMSGTAVDITQRYLAEEALRASEARLAGIIEVAPEAIVTTDGSSLIQVFNKNAELTFGYRADEVIGQPLDILIPERLRDVHREHVESFAESDSTFRIMDNRGDIIGLRKDGTEFPAAASVSKHEVGGEPIYTVMLHDVSETRQAQRRMREHEGEIRDLGKKLSMLERTSSLGLLVAAIVHELNQPIAALTLYARRLMRQAEIWPEAPEHIVESLREIDRLAIVTNGIVQRVRQTVQPSDGLSQVIYCTDAIKQVLSLIERELKPGISVTVSEESPGLAVQADPSAFELIVLNLLRNAIDAIRDNNEAGNANDEARIDVRIEETGDDAVRVSVADNGPGLSDDIRERLFEPLATTKETGWGMGLALCRQFAEDMGGTLSAADNKPNGAIMMLTLPQRKGA